VVKDPSGLFLVEYSVEPKKISVDSYGGKYGVNFELDGRVSDAKGTTVYQYVKEYLGFQKIFQRKLIEHREKYNQIPLFGKSFQFNPVSLSNWKQIVTWTFSKLCGIL
jgi:hypothetical protein